MFEEISERLVPYLKKNNIHPYVEKSWVYRSICLVVDFRYKGVDLKYNLTPDKTGFFAVDVMKRETGIDVSFLPVPALKQRIAEGATEQAAFESMRNSFEVVMATIDDLALAGPALLAQKKTAGVTRVKKMRGDPLKIGLMTLPLNKNIGGNLQIFAMQEKLRQMGHQPVVICRKHPPGNFTEDAETLNIDANTPAMADNYGMSEALKNASFVNSKLVPATRTFFSSAQLKNNIYDYNFDAVIVGSDQVWRAKYARTISKDFFFDFLSDHPNPPKRLSYAASFGADTMGFDPEVKDAICNLIKKFDGALVREDSAVSLCEDELHASAQHVLDPTLLLKPADYVRLVEDKAIKYTGNRLTAYLLDANPKKISLIADIEERLNLKSYSTNGMPLTNIGNLKNENGDQSIESWLASFYSAKFIVTDSFHGVAFSILFNRPFIAYGNAERGMARFTSLLKMFGLSHRLILNAANINLDELLTPIDWNLVNKRLDLLRAESLFHLNNALYDG